MRHPIKLGSYMGCLMKFYESVTPFYTKRSFKILKFFTSVFHQQYKIALVRAV
jgi:hypothetical protein